MADYTYETPQASMTQTPHGVFPSQSVSQMAQSAAQGRRRRGENVVTPVPTGYSVVPAPQQGQGRYGLVPGAVGLPDPHGDLASVFPNLDATDSAASSALLSKLEGHLSPDTIANIENIGATYGITSGMPGSDMGNNLTARDLGLTSEQLQQQGLADLPGTLGAVSSTQTLSPALQASIAEQNAVSAAMPNPQMASEYSKKLFDEYMQQLTNPGGGSGMFGMDQNTSSQIGQYAQLAGTVLSLLA